ncbi:helix-turn-helix domain-containing protein [Streptomyces sp. NBC_00555]|uniref:helix-turn-helix domain-containing protein n=1 Tax=Streptomyces sp. NBC_00555 TaxID=2903662 RepID=UPI002257D07B|nr:helix-turn-helix transcriptional regulator [Streptomyces sp. NBC_00555]MCX5014551.1 helix-turn-helix domain-containing protein [Streptomyces sp. NBC_00555]
MGEAERSGETETFARLMRELKERAGLSYGVLARKLHTSTSTLHRYCNGEAVPTEFAAVDRFARVCGASPGEAVELHRAWLLADARRRAAARTSEPESEPEAEPEPVAVRLPWYRRRAAAVLAAGVTAGAVAVAVLAVSLPERGSPPGAGAGPRAGAVGTATPTAPASSSPSPVPSPTPTAVPLKAAVRSHVWAFGCDHAYLAEPGPGSVPPPPMEADAPAWASAQRAVHAGTQIVEITLHGTGTGSVVLEDLEVRVAARRTPPAWNVYQMSQGCGGALTPAAFAVNLDAPRPLVRPVAGNDTGSAVPAPAFPLRVSASEPAVLRVEAVTTGCDCDWSLDLRWTAPSGSGTLRIDDHGRPLRTSAATGRPVYGYAMEQGRWAR